MSFNKLLALASILALTTACHKPAEPKQEHREAAPVAVTTRAVERQSWPETFEALGTVRARASSTVSARVMAYVQQITVREGDTFAAGQTLVTLDSRDLASGERQARTAVDEARSAIPEADSAIASSKAQLELTQTTFKRIEDLLAKRSVSQQEFDEAAARVKVAQSAVKMAEARRAQLNEKIRQAEQAVRTAGI
ncbi:MAG: efflux RND transporter periplasmic adaptor subunit, partial [Bryobacteraceae bacterium]